MNWHPESVAIAASAGYGKTEILCMRLLAIMLLDPENLRRTAAMTFTRTAAGEILERALYLTAKALTSPGEFAGFRKKLMDLNQSDAFSGLTEAELSRLLVRLCMSLNEIAISTIDSFMIRMAGSCAMELGFFSRPVILAPEQGEVRSAGILRQLFAVADPDIAEICKELLIGSTNRTCADACEELIRELADCHDRFPDLNCWGTIPGPLEMTPQDGLAEALANCDNAAPGPDYEVKLRPLLVHCAQIRSAEEKFTRKEKEILNLFFAVWEDFPAVKPAGYSRNWDFSGCAEALRRLLARARDILLIQTGVRTRAAGRLLARFLDLYRKSVWDRGCLQFADLPRLLTQLPETAVNDLQFRMNLQFRHFLFDEFQDTSRMQWQVFAPIVQDDGSGEQSVFLVGDVKQAIYGWRSGDSRLMGEASTGIQHRELGQSFRYGQAICDALNMLFLQFLPGCSGVRDNVRKRWAAEFHEHKPSKDRPGCFQLLNVCTDTPEPGRDFTEDAALLIAARLKELAFRERRIRCAVLVRSNQQGVQLRNALAAQPGLTTDDVVWEGDEKIGNDRVNRGLLALLYHLQHPGDTSSAELLRMDPVLNKLLPETPEEYAAMNADLADLGLTAFLCRCFRRIGQTAGPAADALLAAARQFEAADQEGDLARFRDLAEAIRFHAAGQAGKVQIMTIHHSKGLTFDAVFVPFFPKGEDENFMGLSAAGPLAGGDWLLYNPGMPGMTAPAIRHAAEESAGDRQFEALCVLYVALTRARHEVCVLLPNLNKDQRKYYNDELSELKRGVPQRRMRFENARTYAPRDLLFDAFFSDTELFPVKDPLEKKYPGGVPVLSRVFGNCQWFRDRTAEPPVRPPELFTLPPADTPPERPRRIAPNRAGTEQESFRFPSRSNTAGSGTAFGTEVHAFFEKIGCWRDFTPPEDTPEAVRKHFESCRSNPEIMELLSQKCELWRERRFDIILYRNGEKIFLSGCFDRVQIKRDAAGNILHAEIIDYKSNDVDMNTLPDAVKHYTMQMTTYRQALAQLLGMAEKDITCTLLFTKPGVLRRID